jgi:hypothetical protein
MTPEELQKIQRKPLRCRSCDFKSIKKVFKSSGNPYSRKKIVYCCDKRMDKNFKLKKLQIKISDLGCSLHSGLQNIQLENIT